MTALMERGRSKSGPAFVPGQPQVNLLPPEVKAARGLKALKRVLALLVILVIGACVAGFVIAFLDKKLAQDGLAEAQDETVRLQADIKQYSEVPLVRGQLESARSAREMGMSTEVLWQQYYGAITAVLPPNTSLDSLTVTQATPMTAPAAASSPLQDPSIGQISFTARALTLPDTAAWIDALNSIPGLGDAWVSSASLTIDSETETPYYEVAASVQIRESAYAHRFVVPDEATEDTTATETDGGQ